MGRSEQRGVSLIEALVGLFVLALGLLAMARLQAGHLTEARNTNARALAVQMAADLKERMLLNPGAMTAKPADNPYLTGFKSAPPEDLPDCSKRACNPSQIAQSDLAAWKQQLAALLPDGDAQVFNADGDRHQFGVLIAWSDGGNRQRARAEAASEKEDVELLDEANGVWQSTTSQGTGVKDAECPMARICHLVHLRP
jgi:type IV pilus assembly protein PilV